MSKLSRMQTRLATVQARLVVIEETYDGIQKIAAYRHNFGEQQADYQRFRDVAAEYWRLLDEAERLEELIAAINGTDDGPTGSTGVAVSLPI